MTAKPSPVGAQVGIQRYSYDPGMEAWIISTDGIYVRHFDHKERYNAAVTLNNDSALKIVQLEAVLNRVREMLEAKAKEWQQPGMYFGVGKDYQAAVEGAYKGCADYLLSLAATLGEHRTNS